MASDEVRDLANTIMGTRTGDNNIPPSPTEPLERPQELQVSNYAFVSSTLHLERQLITSPSYVWTTDDSIFSGDVDRWIGGDNSPTQAGIQNSGSTLAMSSSIDSTGFWYVAAMMLPLFSLGRTRTWRCSPSVIVNTVELLLSQVVGFCRHARSRLRRMTREEAARDIFAGAMDIILVAYAVGFLLLSMYQATVFGHI